jgi:hypothetical protein
MGRVKVLGMSLSTLLVAGAFAAGAASGTALTITATGLGGRPLSTEATIESEPSLRLSFQANGKQVECEAAGMMMSGHAESVDQRIDKLSFVPEVDFGAAVCVTPGFEELTFTNIGSPWIVSVSSRGRAQLAVEGAKVGFELFGRIAEKEVNCRYERPHLTGTNTATEEEEPLGFAFPMSVANRLALDRAKSTAGCARAITVGLRVLEAGELFALHTTGRAGVLELITPQVRSLAPSGGSTAAARR